MRKTALFSLLLLHSSSLVNSQDHGSMDSIEGHGSMETTEGHGSMETTEGHGSMETTESHGSMETTGGHGSMGTTEDHGSMETTEGHGSMETTGGHVSMEGGSTPVDMSSDGSTPVLMTGDSSTTPSSGSTDDVCYECIEILGDDMYTGKYTKMDGPAQCPTSCDYMKENDDRIWCFKPGNYDFDECSGTSNIPGMSTMPPREGNKFRNVREILRKNRFHG